MLLALGFFGGSTNEGWLVTLVVSVLLIQVGLDIDVRLQWQKSEMAPNTVTTLDGEQV